MNLQHIPAQAMGNRERSEKTNTRLSGRWLLLARIGWVSIAVASFSLFLLGLPSYATELHTICTTNRGACYLDGALSPVGLQTLHDYGISLDGYIWYTLVVTVLVALIWASAGLVIFLHRSDDWMALLVSLFLVMFNVTLSGGPMASLVHFFPLFTLPVECLGFLEAVLIGVFFYLFPNGRFVPRWMAWIFVMYSLAEMTSSFLPLNSTFNLVNWPVWLFSSTLLAFVGSVIFSQVYRYRHGSTLRERQQIKWVLYGIAIALVGMFILNLLPVSFNLQFGLFNLANDLLYFIVFLAIPLSIGVAMLRSHLYDIDIIINRTLVYAALTVLLALVYFGLIFGLQFLLRGVINQNSPIAIVASTLVIAALFQPLRHRIQRIIDRRFYRRKYDAAKIVEAFSATLRNEVDLNQLHEQLITVVQDTMQPTHVSLWLRQPTRNATPTPLMSKASDEASNVRE